MEPWFLSIQKTLAYFDQFSHPLTATELWTFLWQPPAEKISWNDFLQIIEEAVKAGKMATAKGFYFLPNKEINVESRQRAQVLVEKKITIARQAVSVLAAVPGVEAIFICNTVAAGWPSVNSDIDLLVVVKPGRLWLTRFLFTITTMVLTKRRHDHRVADHLCLSFYLTRDHLNLAEVRGSSPDIYLIYWLQQLIFLSGDPLVLTELAKANNWVREYTPNCMALKYGIEPLGTVSGFGRLVKQIGESLCFGWLEKGVRQFQKSRIDSKPHASAPAVVISDHMLKFHEQDKREEYQRIWEEKIAQLNSGL